MRDCVVVCVDGVSGRMSRLENFPLSLLCHGLSLIGFFDCALDDGDEAKEPQKQIAPTSIVHGVMRYVRMLQGIGCYGSKRANATKASRAHEVTARG